MVVGLEMLYPRMPREHVAAPADQIMLTARGNATLSWPSQLVTPMSIFPLVAVLGMLLLALLLDQVIGQKPKPPPKSPRFVDVMERIEFSAKLPLLLFIGCMSLVADSGYGVAVAFLPAEILKRGLSQALVGVIVGAHAIGSLIFAYVSPLLLRSFAPLKLVRTAMLIMGIASICFGVSMSITQSNALLITVMIASRLLYGGALAVSEVAAQALVYRMVNEPTVPFANAIISGIRALGMLGSPAAGALLYAVGGFPAPFVCIATGFLALYVLMYLVMALQPADLNPEAARETVSVWELLRVAPTLPVHCLLAVTVFAALAYEPLYQPLLTRPPYSLSTVAVGGVAVIHGGASFLFSLLVSAWLHVYVGVTAQQLVGALLSLGGLACIGPSRLLAPYWPSSLSQFVLGLTATGAGASLLGVLNPTLLLNIMWTEQRRTKRELAPSIVATNLFSMMAGAVLAPIVSSVVYTQGGIGWVSSVNWIAFFLIAVPSILYLAQYSNPPARGPFAPAKKQDDDDIPTEVYGGFF